MRYLNLLSNSSREYRISSLYPSVKLSRLAALRLTSHISNSYIVDYFIHIFFVYKYTYFFLPTSSKGAEPEFRSPRVKLLWDKWRHVWMLAWERQRRLQDKYNYIQELDRVANFSWEDWRKRVRLATYILLILIETIELFLCQLYKLFKCMIFIF